MGANLLPQPRVSVVIPTHNGQRTVAYTVLNLLAQSYPREAFEIILVDDNSTDDTRSVLELISEVYSPRGFRITILRNTSSGASSARNSGIRAAKGEIVAFADQDVFVPSGWLQEIVSAMGSKEVAGVYGGLVTDFANFLEPLMTASVNKKYLTACCAYRRDVLLGVGLFDETFPFFREDSELAYRLIERGNTVIGDPRLFVYHPLKKLRWKDLKDGVRLSRLDPLLFKMHPKQSADDVFHQVVPRLTPEGLAFLVFIATLAVLLVFLPPTFVLLAGCLMILAAVLGLAVIRSSYKGKQAALRLEGAIVSLLLFFLTVLGRIIGSMKYRKLLV